MKGFIDAKEIFRLLKKYNLPKREEVIKVIKKAIKLRGLSCKEASVLLNCEDKKLIRLMLKTARKVKEDIYGKRLVLFAPIYLSNKCGNNCLYCGFRSENKILKRKQLNQEEIRKEIKFLLKEGHKRVLIVTGEHKDADIRYIEESIRTVYNTQLGNGSIRRVNANIAPLSVKDFKKLKEAGIGTYQLFHETYHPPTYKQAHPSGTKKDYIWRLFAMDRAQKAGINDVGIGVLFGLYNPKFEVLAMLQHCAHLEKKFGVGPHTISVPRIEPALNSPYSKNPAHPISDSEFKKIIGIIRLAVPYTGIILSTREKPSIRDQIFKVGVSQISAGSRTNPGAYSKIGNKNSGQFRLGDNRTTAEVITDISKKGFYPSFCTACYRIGRTGKDFMDLAKPGKIKNFCLPNCLLTFKEYLLDYGHAEINKIGNRLIRKELKKLKTPTKLRVIKKLKEIEEGKRDLYV